MSPKQIQAEILGKQLTKVANDKCPLREFYFWKKEATVCSQGVKIVKVDPKHTGECILQWNVKTPSDIDKEAIAETFRKEQETKVFEWVTI